MTWAQLSFYRLSDHFLPCWRSIDATNQSSLIIFEDSCQGFRASCLAMVVYGPLYWNQARGLSEITVKKEKKIETNTFKCGSVSCVKSHSFKATTTTKTCVATGRGSDSDPRLCPSLRLYEGVCLKMNGNPREFVPAAHRWIFPPQLVLWMQWSAAELSLYTNN